MKLEELEHLREIRTRQMYLRELEKENPDSLDAGEYERLEAEREEIVRKIRLIPHRHRVILELYYDRLLTWMQVAAVVHMDIRNVYRIRKELLKDGGGVF